MPAKSSPNATLVAMRAAHHPEATPHYDRVVFELRGPMPQIRVEYVPQLIEDGSGQPVAIDGNVILRVQLSPAQAHSDDGRITVPRRMAADLPNVKEVVGAGDFEAQVTYGIGLDHRAELRILTLANPYRLVIDVMQD